MSRERGLSRRTSEIYSSPMQPPRIDSSPVFWSEPGETAKLTHAIPLEGSRLGLIVNSGCICPFGSRTF